MSQKSEPVVSPETLIDQLEEIVYVSDLKTYEMQYLNLPGRRLCGLAEGEDYRGKHCYEILHGLADPCPFCTNQLLKKDSPYVWEFDNTFFKRHYLLKDKLIQWEGRLCRMEFAIDITEKEVVSQQLQEKLELEEKVVSYIASVQGEDNVDPVMNQLLSTVLEYYDADRCCIWETGGKPGGGECTYSCGRSGWSYAGMSVCPIPGEALRSRIHAEKKPVLIEDLEELREAFPEDYKRLKRSGIERSVLCPLFLESDRFGILAVQNARAHQGDTSFLSTLSYFAQTLVNKRDLQENLLRTNSILSAAPCAFYQMEAQPPFRLLFANDLFFEERACTREQVEKEYGGTAEAFVHPEDLERVKTVVAALGTERYSTDVLQFRILARDQHIKWVLCGFGLTKRADKLVLSGIEYDITGQKQTEEQLRISEEQFRIALAQIDAGVWEYNVATRTVTQTDLSKMCNDLPQMVRDLPESVIENGYIHPDSAEVFRDLYRRIHAGEKVCSATYKARSKNGEYRWEKVTYTNIFDDRGKPVRAIAMSEDVSAQTQAQERYHRELVYRDAISPDLFASYKINLVKDQVENFKADSTKEQELSHAQTYESLLRDGAKKTINAEDRRRMLQTLDYQALLKSYKEGKPTVFCEYQRVDSAGKIAWVRTSVNLMKDPENGDLLGFLYIRSIDEHKKLELALRERAERDPMTGFYSKETTEAMVGGFLGEGCRQNVLCALMMVDLDNFKYINDTLGHLYGDQVLTDLSHAMRSCFDSHTIIGRVGGDEFVVFLHGIPDLDFVCKKAEQLCSILNLSYQVEGEHLHISGSVGIAAAMSQETVYRVLFDQADRAMYEAKRSGKNDYKVFNPLNISASGAYLLPARDTFHKETLLEELDLPIAVIDCATHEILFFSSRAKTEFQLAGSCLGRHCYEALHNQKTPCLQCVMQVPDSTAFHSRVMHCECIEKDVTVRSKRITWGGRKAYFCLLDPNGQQVLFSPDSRRQETLLDAVSALQEHKELNASLKQVLQSLGAYYGAQHCYYLEISPENETFSAAVEWCAKGAPSRLDAFSASTRQEVLLWISAIPCGVPYLLNDVESIRDSHPEEYRTLKGQGVVSFYASSFRLPHQVNGYLCVFNPTENKLDYDLIGAMAPFVANEVSRQKLEREQEFLSYHDDLTGLLNRNSYRRYLSRTKEETLSSLGVVCADINGLKRFNTQFGHAYGDEIVARVAGALKACFSDGSVYRLTGDEFLVLCEDISYNQMMSEVSRAQELTDLISPALLTMGSVWETYDIQVEALVANADERMRVEKQNYYAQTRDVSKHHQPVIRDNLVAALQNREFQIYLQPKAQTMEGEVCGAEALIRYLHPTLGVIPPGKYIPMLEQTNLIHYVDLFVFQEVCALLKRWKEEGRRPILISLNFSRATMLQAGLVPRMLELCEEYGVDPHQMEIEVTETLGDMNQETISEISGKIRRERFRISLDDFGSKYSSLSILSIMKFDVLKLDRSLVNNLANNESTHTVAESVVGICRKMGIESIAEGVETEEQLHVLKEIGCDMIQGYLLNKPIPVDLFERKYMTARSFL